MNKKKIYSILAIIVGIMLISALIYIDKTKNNLSEELKGSYQSKDMVNGESLQFNFLEGEYQLYISNTLVDKGSFKKANNESKDIYIYNSSKLNGYVSIYKNSFYFYIPENFNSLIENKEINNIDEGVYLIEKVSDVVINWK